MTALLTVSPKYVSAIVFILMRTFELISSGDYSFNVAGIFIYGRSAFFVISNGNSFLSCVTVESLYFLPISLFASNTVFTGFNAA